MNSIESAFNRIPQEQEQRNPYVERMRRRQYGGYNHGGLPSVSAGVSIPARRSHLPVERAGSSLSVVPEQMRIDDEYRRRFLQQFMQQQYLST